MLETTKTAIDWTPIITTLLTVIGTIVSGAFLFIGSKNWQEWRKGREDKRLLDTRKTSNNNSRLWFAVIARAEQLIEKEVIDQFITVEITQEINEETKKSTYLFNVVFAPRPKLKPEQYINPYGYTYTAFDQKGFECLQESEENGLQVLETKSLPKCDFRIMKNNEGVKTSAVGFAEKHESDHLTVTTFLLFERFSLEPFTSAEIMKLNSFMGSVRKKLR